MASAAHGVKSARELYSIAKRQGTWEPEQIPVVKDRADLQRVPGVELWVDELHTYKRVDPFLVARYRDDSSWQVETFMYGSGMKD